MKILVTGALGYIGTELLYRLGHRSDVTVYAIDNNEDAIKTRLGFLMRHPNIHFINADITNISAVRQLPRVDRIVHLAAVVGYMHCDNTPDLARLTNILGTHNIANLVTPTVFLSTGSVYGKIGHECDETVDLNPQTLYAETKVEGEHIIKSVQHTVLRPATAFGLSFKVRHDLLVHTLAQDAIRYGKIKLYQPNAMRSFYSVGKLAELCEYACDHFEKFDGRTFNVGCESGNVKKVEIANMIKQHADFQLELVDGEDLDTRNYNVRYDRLRAVWARYDEDFPAKIESVVGYYKQWITKQ
jgi:nucleoside-diphosphate-sugar epimerase